MGLQSVPLYIGKTGFANPVENDRQFIRNIFGRRTGLIRVGDFAIAPTATVQQFSIAAGAAVIIGVENATQGAYLAWSDATENKLVGVPSGQPRIDTLLLRVEDDQYGTIPGSPLATWDVVAGVAAASPSARADSDFLSGGAFYIPGTWWRAADIRVNPGDGVIPGGQITTFLRYARAGGYTICTSGTRPSDPVEGDKIFETDSDRRYWYTGSKWFLEHPLEAIKTADTSRANTTVLAADPHLSLSLDANSTYSFELEFAYSGTTTPQIKTALTGPSGSSGNIGAINIASSGSGAFAGAFATTIINSSGAGTGFQRIRGRIVTTNAGTFALTWAQSTSSATASTIYDGASLRATQIS